MGVSILLTKESAVGVLGERRQSAGAPHCLCFGTLPDEEKVRYEPVSQRQCQRLVGLTGWFISLQPVNSAGEAEAEGGNSGCEPRVAGGRSGVSS